MALAGAPSVEFPCSKHGWQSSWFDTVRVQPGLLPQGCAAVPPGFAGSCSESQVIPQVRKLLLFSKSSKVNEGELNVHSVLQCI